MTQRRNEVIPANVIAASALTNDDFDRALEGSIPGGSVGHAPLRLWNCPSIRRVLARSRVPSSSKGIGRMNLGRTLPILVYFLPAIPWAFLSWFPTVQQFKFMGWLL